MKKQKTRQRIRKAILLFSLLLFPAALNYFSPVIPVSGAMVGVINGSIITFALLFLFSLVLGRAWCGWVCPAGSLMELCFGTNNKPVRCGKFSWIKYFIWVPWLSAIAILAIRSGGYHEVNPFFFTETIVTTVDIPSYIRFYMILSIFIVLSYIFGRRAGCHYLCWMAPFMIIGNASKNLIKWPSLHLQAVTENCTNCKLCTRNCPMSLDVNSMVQKGSMKHSECILCGECVDNCPKDVIHYSFGSPK
jgi:ferredoxin-type protein NapH